MARGKSKARGVPKKVHAEHYLCTLCWHHHGRRTKIAAAHRQYRQRNKA